MVNPMDEVFSRINVSGRQVAAVVVFVIVAAVAQMAIPSLLGTMIDVVGGKYAELYSSQFG